MGAVKSVPREIWRVIRFLATGRTNSRRDRQALASYWRYQADERAREAQEGR